MSKSLTKKTHDFLMCLGLHPVGAAQKVDKLEIEAAAMRKSVRHFLRQFSKDGEREVGDFRLAHLSKSVRHAGGSRRSTATVYMKGTWYKLGWITFVQNPTSQVVDVFLTNEF